jgi:hypothetical protein
MPLGSAATVALNLKVDSSAAAPFTPTHVGAGVTGVLPGGVNLEITFTITNGGSSPYDTEDFVANATTGERSTPCSKIFDSMQGIGQTTWPTPGPGESATFKTAFSCPGMPGDPLRVAIASAKSAPSTMLLGQLPPRA